LPDPFPGYATLTPRERVVLAQIVRGFSNKQIARAFGISPRTVELHRINLLKKVGARNPVDLMPEVLGEQHRSVLYAAFRIRTFSEAIIAPLAAAAERLWTPRTRNSEAR